MKQNISGKLGYHHGCWWPGTISHHQDISRYDIDGLVQDRHNSIANALELRLSFTKPSLLSVFLHHEVMSSHYHVYGWLGDARSHCISIHGIHLVSLKYFGSCLTRVKSSGAETRIFWKNKVNTMAVDALDPCVAKSSPAMILADDSVGILVLPGSEFPKPMMLQCWGMVWNANRFSWFLRKIQRDDV